MNSEPPLDNKLQPDDAGPDDMKAMLIGAGLIFVVGVTPYLQLVCCLPDVIGALLAVHIFTKQYQLTLTAGRAMRLGILTCLLGAGAAWAVNMGIYLITGVAPGQRQVEDLMISIFSSFGPEVADQVRQGVEQQRQAGLSLWQILFGLFVTVAIASVAGVIGGAIGAGIFKRGNDVSR